VLGLIVGQRIKLEFAGFIDRWRLRCVADRI
jgi:hypothetical protein